MHARTWTTFIVIGLTVVFSCGLRAQGTEPAASPGSGESRSSGLFIAVEAGNWIGWNGKTHPITHHFGLDAGIDLPLGEGAVTLSLRPVVGVGYLSDENFRAYFLAGVLGKLTFGSSIYLLLGPTYQMGTGGISMGNAEDFFQNKQFMQSLYLNAGLGAKLSRSLFAELQWRMSVNKTNYYIFDYDFKAWVYESRHSIIALSVGYLFP